MVALSDKTRAELEAGARQLASNQLGTQLPRGYMDAVMRTGERHAQLQQWERDGKLTIESTKRYTSQPKEPDGRAGWHMIYNVTDGGPSFTDIQAEQQGASPSEVLIANIALALMARGRL